MAKTRKQRERDAERVADLVAGVAIFVGLWVWLKTKSIYAGVVALLVFLACTATVMWLRRNARRMKIAGRTTIDDLDNGNWEEFEAYLVALFHAKGYKAELTPNGADFGADLVLERNRERTIVQAKHWTKSDVGVKAVQEIVAAKGHYKADKAMVVITGDFTKQAIELARSNGVELWDRAQLAKEMATVRLPALGNGYGDSVQHTEDEPPRQSPLSASIGTEPTVTPLCPRCGSTMVKRTGQYGEFWGCPHFPRCHGTRPL